MVNWMPVIGLCVLSFAFGVVCTWCFFRDALNKANAMVDNTMDLVANVRGELEVLKGDLKWYESHNKGSLKP